MSRNMPFILAALILAIMFFNVPIVVQQVLYSISLSIKSVIIFALPIIIFSLLFKTVISLSSKATKIIGLIFVLVCCSNLVSTFLSHTVGSWVYGFDLSLIQPKSGHELEALWQLSIPQLISNDKAMFAGILSGFLFARFNGAKARIVAAKVDIYIQNILSGFMYFIPLFVAGFVSKLKYDGVIMMIVEDYGVIFLVVACAQLSYISFAYLVLNKFKINAFVRNIANMIPAAISGFSTMSSAASMPLTIAGAEANAKHKDIAKSVIPATVNIHLVGDCFAIPIFAYAILKSFGFPEPSLMQYAIFAGYFVIAKFSVAAIPGGGVIVMLPILQEHLGMTPDMLSLITALYILFDPVITCSNVLGNGAFAKFIDRIVGVLKIKVSDSQEQERAIA